MSNVRPMIRDLTKFVSQLAAETQSNMNDFTTEVNNLKDILAAVVKAVGEDNVNKALEGIMEARIKSDEEANAKAIEMLVEKGILAATDVVEGDVMVVGTDHHSNGKVRALRFELQNLQPEGAAKFIGKRVGETTDLAEDPYFTVTGIYTINREAVKKTPVS